MVKKYEDYLPLIDEILKKSRNKWQLNSLSHIDYDDVCQIIRLHIFKKWHLWNQEKPFEPWCYTVVNHQITNEIRNNYGKYSRPCLKCVHNKGCNLCSFTSSGEQDTECELFSDWQNKKSNAYNINMAIPEELVVNEISNIEQNQIDYVAGAASLHRAVLAKLTERNKFIYSLLYIQMKTDEEVAELIGLKGEEIGRKTKRFKQLQNLKKQFFKIAQEVIKETDCL